VSQLFNFSDSATQIHVAALLIYALLVFMVMLVLGRRRFEAAKAGLFPKDYFKVYRSDAATLLPVRAEQASRNYSNLFEMPLLFVTATFLLLVSGWQSGFTASMSLAFILTRCLHSFVHLGSNKIKWRFRLYLLSTSILALVWGAIALKFLLLLY